MSGDMAKLSDRILETVSVSSRRFERFAHSVRARFHRISARVGTLEATVEPLVDHVANLEEMIRDLDRRQRPRRRGRRAA